MKNLSSKIVVTLASLALIGGLAACTSTVSPLENDENAAEIESSDSETEEDGDEEIASSSSAKKVASSSSAKKAASSSSSIASNSSSSRNDIDEEDSRNDNKDEEVLPEKVDDKKDSVAVVEKEDLGDKVEETDLPEGLTEGDSLTGDSLYVGEGDFDFENNDYYCKTPEGDWYVLDGSKYNTFWYKLWDKIVLFFTGKTWLDYSKVCDVIYVHPKF